jgi:hypothetical protein
VTCNISHTPLNSQRAPQITDASVVKDVMDDLQVTRSKMSILKGTNSVLQMRVGLDFSQVTCDVRCVMRDV